MAEAFLTVIMVIVGFLMGALYVYDDVTIDHERIQKAYEICESHDGFKKMSHAYIWCNNGIKVEVDNG